MGGAGGGFGGFFENKKNKIKEIEEKKSAINPFIRGLWGLIK